MLYRLARAMQLTGLLILPIAIAGEVAGKLALWKSLSIAAVGGGVFIAGWLLQQTAGPK